MSGQIVHIGIDVHQGRVVWCAVDENGEVVGESAKAARRGALRKLARVWLRKWSVICSWYEAGPCGYWLHRLLEEAGIDSRVVVPALTPVRPGERVKTDRRDARKLAEMGMAGMLVEVVVPDEEWEAARALLRLRGCWRDEVRRIKTWITHFLNRLGVVY